MMELRVFAARGRVAESRMSKRRPRVSAVWVTFAIRPLYGSIHAEWKAEIRSSRSDAYFSASVVLFRALLIWERSRVI